MKTSQVLSSLAAVCLINFAASAQDGTVESDTTAEADFFQLTLNDLLSIEVVTASNSSEKLNKAPATILVVTEQDIRERGYMEMYDIFNDMPGFDLSRAFGDDQYYLYTRGFRKTLSDQMLFMVDGVIMNHLYNNNMNAFLQYPIYNIKQIEVVYGPASAVYGANAFSGVINIITKKDGKSTLFLSKGGPNSNLVDMNLSRKAEDFTVNLSGRLYHTNGANLSNRTPFLTDTLYTSKKLWGPFQATDFLGYKSPINTNYLSASVQFKGLTVGALNWFSESGYGSEYPGDKVLNAGKWQFDEQTVYARYEAQIGKLSSKTLMHFRQSGNPESSMFIENDSKKSDASYWQTNNKAFTLFQDFSYDVSDKLKTNFGVKYFRRNLQRAYDVNYGPSIKQDSVMTKAYPFPANPYRGAPDQDNHGSLEDQGIYGQVKYSPASMIDIVAGARFDYNSVWKGVFSPRVGLVVSPNEHFVAKAFFGTAFLEPTARVLYGGWQGSLSNPDVKPEKMSTFEASAAYTRGVFSVGADFYANTGYDVIAQDSKKKPINLGKRSMIGGDVFLKFMTQDAMGFVDKIKADVYVSFIDAKESATDTDPLVATGNIAPVKFHGLISAYMFQNLCIGIQSRYVSSIKTVSTNPIPTIDGWFVADANISYNNLLTEGLSIGLKVYNVFNADYFHPGYRDASAGEVLYKNGVRQNSAGWYNSRLPQPFRQAHLTLRFDF